MDASGGGGVLDKTGLAQRPEAVLLLHLRSTLPTVFTIDGRGGGAGPGPCVQLDVEARRLAIAGGAEEAAPRT